MDYETLVEKGERIKSILDGTVNLYILDKKEYVVLCDNTVITREEDNDAPEGAFFPYKK